MCLTYDSTFLISGSHDCCKFWSVEDIPKLKTDVAEEEEEEEGSCFKRRKRKRKRKQTAAVGEKSGRTAVNDFFADL